MFGVHWSPRAGLPVSVIEWGLQTCYLGSFVSIVVVCSSVHLWAPFLNTSSNSVFQMWAHLESFLDILMRVCLHVKSAITDFIQAFIGKSAGSSSWMISYTTRWKTLMDDLMWAGNKIHKSVPLIPISQCFVSPDVPASSGTASNEDHQFLYSLTRNSYISVSECTKSIKIKQQKVNFSIETDQARMRLQRDHDFVGWFWRLFYRQTSSPGWTNSDEPSVKAFGLIT